MIDALFGFVLGVFVTSFFIFLQLEFHLFLGKESKKIIDAYVEYKTTGRGTAPEYLYNAMTWREFGVAEKHIAKIKRKKALEELENEAL